MNDTSPGPLLDRLARTAADHALDAFRSGVVPESKAGPLDLVTEVDRAVQQLVVDALADAAPDDPVVGEEDDALKTLPATGPAWVIDPIDGTNNYVAGSRVWAVSLAAVSDGQPVAAVNALPALGDHYAAVDDGVTRNGDPVSVSPTADPSRLRVGTIFGRSQRHRRGLTRAVEVVADRFGDVRHNGCAHATYAMVADGTLDAAVATVPLAPWDTVAGVHLVRAAGGTVTDLSGAEWTPVADGLLVSNGRAHDALIEAFEPTPE